MAPRTCFTNGPGGLIRLTDDNQSICQIKDAAQEATLCVGTAVQVDACSRSPWVIYDVN
eukprot:Awhi_evm1s2795